MICRLHRTVRSDVRAGRGPHAPANPSKERATDFITSNTRQTAPPLVPEITLHLAEESLPIWQRTEIELGRSNVPPPFWAFAWAGGQAIARYILDHPQTVSGLRVLDLGSGSGLGAIAAMKAGAACALAADIDPMAGLAAELNATLNSVSIGVTKVDLLNPELSQLGDFDVVLVADVFYEREMAERVLAFARRHVGAGANVIVGDPRRTYFPADAFEKIAEYDVPVSRELEDTELKRAAIWSLSPLNET